jgi:hypothetical protein
MRLATPERLAVLIDTDRNLGAAEWLFLGLARQ